MLPSKREKTESEKGPSDSGDSGKSETLLKGAISKFKTPN